MFELLSPAGVVSAALIAPPGPEVIAELSRLDPAALSDSARVDLLVAWERQAAWVSAATVPVLAAVGDAAQSAAAALQTGRDASELPLRSAHAEISAALRMSEMVAAARLKTARSLTAELAPVCEALAAGDISYWHANAIAEATGALSAEQAAWVAGRVLPAARKQTVAQLRRSLRRAVLAVAPQTAAARARQAHQERRLDWWALPDGMAELRLIASASDVMTAYTTANALASRMAQGQPNRGSDGWEPMDALRADALIQLICGAAPTGNAAAASDTAADGRRVTVQLTMDLPTLLGLRDNPAELAGYGPLPAPLARMLATDAKWRRLLHEPHTGRLLDLGRTSYLPSAELGRFIRSRDGVCAFPTCNRAAQHCDLDHTQPYRPGSDAGGRTDRNNLGALCDRHHRLKHEAGWTLCRDPISERATWTSPAGRRHLIDHHDYRSLDPSDLPDEPPPPTQPEPTVIVDVPPDCGLSIVPPDPDLLPDPDNEPPEIPMPTADYELVA
jgi:hypothetical protein